MTAPARVVAADADQFDLDDGVGEGAWCFLRQVVPDAAADDPMRELMPVGLVAGPAALPGEVVLVSRFELGLRGALAGALQDPGFGERTATTDCWPFRNVSLERKRCVMAQGAHGNHVWDLQASMNRCYGEHLASMPTSVR